MKTLIAGDCKTENIFRLVDPALFSEEQFEAEAIKAFRCLYPEYFCEIFRGAFTFEGITKRSDIALIHKSMSHWFVVEAELISHSLEQHVLPQMRCLRFGDADDSCITSICNNFRGFDRQRAESLIRYVPRSAAVVVNRHDTEWEYSLTGLDTQMVVVSIFKEDGGRTAHELQGQLYVVKQSLGFFKYSSVDKSFKVPVGTALPLGTFQMEDPFGILGYWTARQSGESIWVTKDIGDPALPHGEYIQVIRAYDGKLTMRLPR